jgi:crotonobetainyl-CoA:carnitine CoA-transferase CaiB-like acyl-CoA transferase
MAGALEDIRVVELTTVRLAPWPTQIRLAGPTRSSRRQEA